MEQYKSYAVKPKKRYRETISFMRKHLPPPATILDLGIRSELSALLEIEGYTVYNTEGEDLDLEHKALNKADIDAVTAFEILEHLISPFTLLSAIRADKLVATVPLNLWFSAAYRSKTDLWDRHYHEFEDWQFDWLLEKAGWRIEATKKWTSPVKTLGFRPILRWFTPRYYAVFAQKVKS